MRSGLKYLILFGALVVLSGCATMRATDAYNSRLERLVTRHIYAKDCMQIERTIRTSLFDDGYRVLQSDGLFIETDWRPGAEGKMNRYLVQLQQRSTHACAIQARLGSRSRDSQGRWSENSSRDWRFEYKVLRVQDPRAARQYEDEAGGAGECARQERYC